MSRTGHGREGERGKEGGREGEREGRREGRREGERGKERGREKCLQTPILHITHITPLHVHSSQY